MTIEEGGGVDCCVDEGAPSSTSKNARENGALVVWVCHHDVRSLSLEVVFALVLVTRTKIGTYSCICI